MSVLAPFPIVRCSRYKRGLYLIAFRAESPVDELSQNLDRRMQMVMLQLQRQ